MEMPLEELIDWIKETTRYINKQNRIAGGKK